MTDNLTVEQRSAQMSLIKSKDTKPELAVRRLVYSLGYRYRLHADELPGKPDIVFRPRRKAIFVHGCFWHGHECPRGQRMPKTNREYWHQKINKTILRDSENVERLQASDWQVMVVWECQLKDLGGLAEEIKGFLETE